jgi:hypothetical protein
MPLRATVRTGLEVTLMDHLMLRFGYARAPKEIRMAQAMDKHAKITGNIFTGGAGISLDPVALDFYFGEGVWGGQLSLSLLKGKAVRQQ